MSIDVWSSFMMIASSHSVIFVIPVVYVDIIRGF